MQLFHPKPPQNTKHWQTDVCLWSVQEMFCNYKQNKPHANMQYIFKHIICHTLNCVFDFAIIFHFLTTICFAVFSTIDASHHIRADEIWLNLHVYAHTKKLQLQSIFLACFSVFYKNLQIVFCAIPAWTMTTALQGYAAVAEWLVCGRLCVSVFWACVCTHPVIKDSCDEYVVIWQHILHTVI